jgi:hypothetical protein
VIKGVVDARSGAGKDAHGEDVGPGSLFATGLVAGGALAGVVVAFLSVSDRLLHKLESMDLSGPLTRALGAGGYQVLGVAFFAVMGITLYRVARRRLVL